MVRRKRDEFVPATEDVLSLSFLDVLSCGLGAAIYLFFVFSVMPHIGVAGAPIPAQNASQGTDARAAAVGVRLDSFDAVAAAPVFAKIHLRDTTLLEAERLVVRWSGFSRPIVAEQGPYEDLSTDRATFLSPQSEGRRRARFISCELGDPEGVLAGTRGVVVEILAGGRAIRLEGEVPFEERTSIFELDLLLEPDQWVRECSEGLSVTGSR